MRKHEAILSFFFSLFPLAVSLSLSPLPFSLSLARKGETAVYHGRGPLHALVAAEVGIESPLLLSIDTEKGYCPNHKDVKNRNSRRCLGKNNQEPCPLASITFTPPHPLPHSQLPSPSLIAPSHIRPQAPSQQPGSSLANPTYSCHSPNSRPESSSSAHGPW